MEENERRLRQSIVMAIVQLEWPGKTEASCLRLRAKTEAQLLDVPLETLAQETLLLAVRNRMYQFNAAHDAVCRLQREIEDLRQREFQFGPR